MPRRDPVCGKENRWRGVESGTRRDGVARKSQRAWERSALMTRAGFRCFVKITLLFLGLMAGKRSLCVEQREKRQ